MTIEQVVQLAFPVAYLSFLLGERIWPRRSNRRVYGWLPISFSFLVLGGLVNSGMVLLADSMVGRYHLADLSGLRLVVQILAGIMLSTLLDTIKHRLQHASGLLWRFHQLHHSSERLDVGTSFYFHPIDIVTTAVLATVVGGPLLGLGPVAAQATGLFFFLAAILSHANVNTPWWIGYFIPRPEAHAIHHERGIHWFNFSSLPLWDVLFGTFRNPRTWSGTPGLEDGATSRLGSMVLGKLLVHRSNHAVTTATG